MVEGEKRRDEKRIKVIKASKEKAMEVEEDETVADPGVGPHIKRGGSAPVGNRGPGG